MTVTPTEVVDMAANGGATTAPTRGATRAPAGGVAQQQAQAAVGEWLRAQLGEALRAREEAIRQEGIEILGGTADMLLIGPFQFFGPPGVPPYPPSDVVQLGEFAFVAVVQAYAPLPNLGGTAPAFALPYKIRLRTGSLEAWSLAETALQTEISGNLNPASNLQLDFFGFVPTRRDLCEMNAWIEVQDALGNPSGVGGFARSVIPVNPPILFPVDPPPSDTGLRFANIAP